MKRVLFCDNYFCLVKYLLTFSYEAIQIPETKKRPIMAIGGYTNTPPINKKLIIIDNMLRLSLFNTLATRELEPFALEISLHIRPNEKLHIVYIRT